MGPGSTVEFMQSEPFVPAERLLQAASDGAVIGQAVVGLDGSFIKVNPALCNLLGYTESELLSLTFAHVTHPDDLAASLRAAQRIASGELRSFVTDKRYVRSDNSVVWVRLHVTPIYSEDGTLTANFSQLLDMTAERAAVEALARSEELFRLIATNTGDLVGSIRGGLVTWASPSSRQFGWDPAELIGREAISLVHPDDRYLVEANSTDVEQGFRSQSEYRVRVRLATKLDGYRWIEAHITANVDINLERRGLIAVVRDVSEQVSTEEALRASERDFRLLAENAADVVIRFGEDGACWWASGSVREVLGWTAEQFIAVGPRALIHPSDSIEMHPEGAQEVAEFRIRHREGHWVWVAMRARELADGTRIEALRAIDDEMESRAAAQMAIEQLAHRSRHDVLTDLLNRDEFVRRLQAHLDEPDAVGRVAVLFVDLDRFKEVNDGLSHAAGDDILRDVARRLGHLTRSCDFAGRLGGDEFAVVFTNIESPQDAVERTNQIRHGVATRDFWTHRQRVPVTVSMGLAIAGTGQDAQALLSDADAALNQAKREGRNRWKIADDQIRQQAQERIGLNGRIRDALDANLFHAWFQPIVDLNSLTTIGYEALARWRSPEGVIPANRFIDAAEDSGAIHELGGIIIAEAIAQLRSLEAGQFITVNASATQLTERGFADSVLRQLRNAGAQPTQLAVEITEHSILNLDAEARHGLHLLSDAGVGLLVDDFGTGYSSLSLLLDFPVSGLKLDGSFARRLTQEPSDMAMRLVSGLAEMTRRLELRGIVEGIEGLEEQRLVAELGWECGQGWLYGSAQPSLSRARFPHMREEAADLNEQRTSS